MWELGHFWVMQYFSLNCALQCAFSLIKLCEWQKKVLQDLIEIFVRLKTFLLNTSQNSGDKLCSSQLTPCKGPFFLSMLPHLYKIYNNFIYEKDRFLFGITPLKKHKPTISILCKFKHGHCIRIRTEGVPEGKDQGSPEGRGLYLTIYPKSNPNTSLPHYSHWQLVCIFPRKCTV